MRTSIRLYVLVGIVLALLAAGCSHDNPAGSDALKSTNHSILPKSNNQATGTDVLYGRAGEVLPTANTVIMKGSRTEVTVGTNASIAMADRQAGTTAPLALTGIKPGDSLELQGTYLSLGSGGTTQARGGGGTGTDAKSDDGGYAPAVFMADYVTVVMADTTHLPPDTLPAGLPIAFFGVLKTVNLDQGSITFVDRPFVGQTTLQTVYSGMFMSPIITLANFAPGMPVRVVGKTAGDWHITVDSLIQIPPPPDSTRPPDTLPLNTPLQFIDEIRGLDSSAHTLRFWHWPYTGQITEQTNIILQSLIICSSMEKCLVPGMKVQVFGRTAGNWVLTLDSIIELALPPDTIVPPDTTIPPDSIPEGTRLTFDDGIQRTDTLHGLVWFMRHPFMGMVTPHTYYAGEFVPGTIPSLRNFVPGSYVRVSGVIDSAGLVIDTLILNDWVPPDTTTPPDTIVPPDTVIPPDTTYPPDTTRPIDTGYIPINGKIFFDLDAFHYNADSMGQSGWAVDLRMQTEQLFECPNVTIANTVERHPGGVNFGILGVTPYECFAQQPGPATRQMLLKFDSVAFVISFTYQGRVDRYGVYVDVNYKATITPFGTPTFTARKEL